MASPARSRLEYSPQVSPRLDPHREAGGGSCGPRRHPRRVHRLDHASGLGPARPLSSNRAAAQTQGRSASGGRAAGLSAAYLGFHGKHLGIAPTCGDELLHDRQGVPPPQPEATRTNAVRSPDQGQCSRSLIDALPVRPLHKSGPHRRTQAGRVLPTSDPPWGSGRLSAPVQTECRAGFCATTLIGAETKGATVDGHDFVSHGQAWSVASIGA